MGYILDAMRARLEWITEEAERLGEELRIEDSNLRLEKMLFEAMRERTEIKAIIKDLEQEQAQ